MTRTVVWITGASRGIGRSLVVACPWQDARVVDVSRSGGADVHAHVAADLATRAGWVAVAESFRHELAELEPGDRAVLIHNAGTLEPIGFAGEVPTPGYDDNVVLNSAAPQALGHRFLSAVRGRDLDASLLVLSSGAATSAYEGWSSYGAGKAAVEHWVRTVGQEQRRRGGVRVYAVAPGVVDTAMQERIRATDPADFPKHERFVELHEQGDLRDPDAVARELWQVLASDAHPTGSVLDLRDL